MSDELRHLRGLAALSQAELDRRAGVPLGTTHDLESRRNQNPSHETATLITRALQRSGLKGVTAEQVFPVEDPVGEPTDESAVAS